MGLSRVSLILIGVILFAGIISGFSSDRSDSGTPPPPPSSPSTQCWNGADDDSDGNTPPDGSSTSTSGPYNADPGCVNPYYNDSNEGMIFDSHFTATMEGLNPNNGLFSEGTQSFNADNTESLFFENSILLGSEQDTVTQETDSSTSSTSKNFYYVDAQRTASESSEAYGFGYLNQESVSVSDFSQYNNPFTGTQDVHFSQSENRFVDTPHDYTEVCGNGMEDDAQDEVNTGLEPLGNQQGYTNGNEIECKGDWGRIMVKYDMDGNKDSVEHNYGNSDLECNDDDGSANAKGSYGSCGGCGGSSSPGSASCTGTKQDYTDSEGTKYYENPNDLIEEYECTRDETCNDGSGSNSHVSNSCDDNDQYSYIDSCSSSSCGSCGNQTDYSVGGTDTTYCGQGHLRSWDGPQDSINCDSSYSVVDGGSRIGDGRLGNDPAATYTEFTSYADNSWTDSDNDGTHGDDTQSNWVDGSGKVWGGYEFAATVNADGPRGNNDGFIVIDEKAGSNSNDVDRVVGRESPNGQGLVGKNVYYGVREAGGSDGSADSALSYDFINEVDLSCSSGKQVCIKYVDFWTDGPGGAGTPGNPTWTIDDSNPSSPSKSDISGAISLDTEEYSLDQSYSVCKAANRIAEKNPESVATSIDWNNGGALVDCDYMRNNEQVSPLAEACGDERNEHLMLMEGPSVDSTVTSQWLGHEQKCVEWDNSETDPNGRELDSNACIRHGEAYAEGTVIDIASPQNIQEDYEEGDQQSPDRHVCLDIDDTTGDWAYNYRHDDTSNTDFGGQWYDLDDDSTEYSQTVNEYLRSMEPNGFTAGSIDSSTAGPSASGDESWIDYYYTENPNPQHDEYNPMGGQAGVALLADCGPKLRGCADDSDNVRGEIAAPGYHDGSTGEGVYFAFSDPSANTFYEDSKDEDFNPLGESTSSSYPQSIFDGRLNKIKSVSNQLYSSHPDYAYLGVSNAEWYYDTHIDEDSATQYAYTMNNTWVPDSTGVPYPAGGADNSIDYISSAGASTGVYPHIDHQSSIRTSTLDLPSLKIRRAHGNSIAVISARDMSRTVTRGDGSSETIDIRDGEAYWVNPDDILVEWSNNNIDRGYWR